MAHSDVQDEQRLTAKGRATRDRIVAAAAQLIVTEGLSASNMENVRRAASVSGSQLAHYFTDKSALIRAVIRRQIGVVLDFHRQPKLGGLASFADFERWIDLNMRYLRRIGYLGTPTYHALAAQLAKSDDATRETLAAGYWQWVDLIEAAIQRMKDDGIVVAEADPRTLAIVIVAAHQGGGTLAFTYRAEWPHADAIRFAINYLRSFATDPGERVARPARRARRLGKGPNLTEASPTRFTRKGQATRAHIVDVAAGLMFERGVAGTSIEQVRRAAGVGGSQITHYFQDKRELTRQVIAARREDVRAFHTQPPLGALDTLDALQAWADACVADIDAVYRLGGCVYGSLAGELIDADDDLHDDLSAGYDQWIELFRTGLAAMRRRGELCPDADPRHLAVSLVAAHQGGAMLTYATGDPEPLRAAVNAAVDYVRAFMTHARRGRSAPPRRRGPSRAK
ncbi:TetR/AcrR family transcriptional regulator [Mycobacterium paraseoulense]|uniref:TetR family transcriptional regulator n=1 Tax=Mycobacterium paraseoulense TaxID=590652 RepID=A0A1X0IGC7_9MYCO|nr:TetR/AcrR family transcriptional regulator [Mycobacterium paraseoulense]MCV7395670.1 TetR/AcrR family transcriptional regulator [Mycobacterium paraseoulense]ORB46060.1 TetR family transcriptional regulator [Mycobacterium paraseoulense]BBZ72066.1 TetR family transcriptional regulator [Mycobacterium paraseoulense]